MTCATTASEVTTYVGIEICMLLLLLLLSIYLSNLTFFNLPRPATAATATA